MFELLEKFATQIKNKNDEAMQQLQQNLQHTFIDHEQKTFLQRMAPTIVKKNKQDMQLKGNLHQKDISLKSVFMKCMKAIAKKQGDVFCDFNRKFQEREVFKIDDLPYRRIQYEEECEEEQSEEEENFSDSCEEEVIEEGGGLIDPHFMKKKKKKHRGEIQVEIKENTIEIPKQFEKTQEITKEEAQLNNINSQNNTEPIQQYIQTSQSQPIQQCITPNKSQLIQPIKPQLNQQNTQPIDNSNNQQISLASPSIHNNFSIKIVRMNPPPQTVEKRDIAKQFQERRRKMLENEGKSKITIKTNRSKLIKMNAHASEIDKKKREKEMRDKISENISFIEKIKDGKDYGESPRKVTQWKQQKTPLRSNNELSRIKEANKKRLQELGFERLQQNKQISENSQIYQHKIGKSLPKINKSYIAKKPIAYNLYNINQKDKQFFENMVQ